MSKYNIKGNEMYEKICKELDIPFKRTGSFVIAFSEEEKKHLEELYKRGIKNGIPGLEIINHDELKELEPNINSSAIAALYAKTAGIIGPWEANIAFIENAMDNGIKLVLNAKVKEIKKVGNGYEIIDDNENSYKTKVIINCAGVYADKIHNMISKPAYEINPRKGQYFVMDKYEGAKVNSVIFQCPTKKGKGVLVVPTVHGNLLLGPDSQEISDKEDTSTTTEQLDFVKKTAMKSVENLNLREVIRSFAGLRAEADRGDFIIEEAKDAKGFFDVGGIKSPGLSAAPAIAEDVVKMILNLMKNVKKNDKFNPFRKKQVKFMELSNKEKEEMIHKDPRYGRIICRCENITEGEIIDSINRNAGAVTVDGVKRRCRPGMGRCQGGFCGPRIQEILAKELDRSPEEIILDKKGSYILTKETKQQLDIKGVKKV